MFQVLSLMIDYLSNGLFSELLKSSKSNERTTLALSLNHFGSTSRVIRETGLGSQNVEFDCRSA